MGRWIYRHVYLRLPFPLRSFYWRSRSRWVILKHEMGWNRLPFFSCEHLTNNIAKHHKPGYWICLDCGEEFCASVCFRPPA